MPLTADDEPDDDFKAETESILAKVWPACDNTHQCVCHLDAMKAQKISYLTTLCALKAESIYDIAACPRRMVLHLKNFPMTYRHACLKFYSAGCMVAYNLGLPVKHKEAKVSHSCLSRI